MQNTSNAVAVNKADAKMAGEKVVEKRRALGRGLESLLPGPRVVTPPLAHPITEIIDGAPGAAASAATSPSLSSSAVTSVAPSGTDSSIEIGRAGAPVAPPATVDLQVAAGPVVEGEGSIRLRVDRIDENPYQTRRTFDEKALMELAQSIRVQGVLQPVVVRPGTDGSFTLILGERRLRAARLAGMEEIPAIVKRVSEQQAAEMTIVENLQRQDLNCVDQAAAFANLSTQFKLTQEQIGARVGMSRESVANYMRLLTLSEGIIEALQKGKLTFSHARALLMVQDPADRWKLAQKAIEEKWSVAALDDVVQGMMLPRASRPQKEGGAKWVDPNVKAAQRSLEGALGMRVRIRDRNGRGRILIDYGTIEDFDRVVRMLNGK